MNPETVMSADYVPARQRQVTGSSFQHDPNQASSTIENLDDDDDEDVYDPSKVTVFPKISSTNNENSSTSAKDQQGSLIRRFFSAL